MSLADPTGVIPILQVNFATESNGKTLESTAVPMEGNSVLVAVVAGGAAPQSLKLRIGNRQIPMKFIGHDPVSRLQFVQAEDRSTLKSVEWLNEIGASSNTSLIAMGPSGPVKCRSTGWVKQVGGKILPFALLRVTFGGIVPPAGTPLMDDSGRVAAIVFQDAGSGNVGYAIPAEAVHRVQQDICNGGQLIRGWLGLSLRAESQSPQVVRVLPDSPASTAGIRSGDVIAAIGTRLVTDYADAVNAFFYLIPGQPVKVKLLRGVDQLEFVLTPAKQSAK